MTSKVLLPLFFFVALFDASVQAQGLQFQAHMGYTGSSAHFKGTEFIERSSLVLTDSVPGAQFGFALQYQFKRGITARLEANYRQYRTSYTLERDVAGPIAETSIGNIFNEKLMLAALLGYSKQVFSTGNWSNHLYGFAGPSISLELDNTYSSTYRFPVYYEFVTDAGPVLGGMVGLGANLRWKYLGIFAELRGGLTGATEENPLLPAVGYRYYSLLAGVTLNL
jgi:hypothetical protein